MFNHNRRRRNHSRQTNSRRFKRSTHAYYPNAVDHGIEDKDTRKKLGKPELATITLFGKSQSDTIIIEIKDDGQGLDVEKIKAKALEKGLYNKDELSLMDNKRIFSIIFQHGFLHRVMFPIFPGEVSGWML